MAYFLPISLLQNMKSFLSIWKKNYTIFLNYFLLDCEFFFFVYSGLKKKHFTYIKNYNQRLFFHEKEIVIQLIVSRIKSAHIELKLMCIINHIGHWNFDFERFTTSLFQCGKNFECYCFVIYITQGKVEICKPFLLSILLVVIPRKKNSNLKKKSKI